MKTTLTARAQTSYSSCPLFSFIHYPFLLTVGGRGRPRCCLYNDPWEYPEFKNFIFHQDTFGALQGFLYGYRGWWGKQWPITWFEIQLLIVVTELARSVYRQVFSLWMRHKDIVLSILSFKAVADLFARWLLVYQQVWDLNKHLTFHLVSFRKPGFTAQAVIPPGQFSSEHALRCLKPLSQLVRTTPHAPSSGALLWKTPTVWREGSFMLEVAPTSGALSFPNDDGGTSVQPPPRNHLTYCPQCLLHGYSVAPRSAGAGRTTGGSGAS